MKSKINLTGLLTVRFERILVPDSILQKLFVNDKSLQGFINQLIRPPN